jgi:hypothetical protein
MKQTGSQAGSQQRTDIQSNISANRQPRRDVTAELMDRLESRVINAAKQAETKAKQKRLIARWHHKAGTPETHEHIEVIPSRKRQNPLQRLYLRGAITLDDLAAAEQIQSVMETLSRAASIRIGSLEMRVDCSASSRNVLVEYLARVRLEVAYSLWRKSLPRPAGLVLQMVCSNLPYTSVAKHYHTDPRTARKTLISALRDWQQIWHDTCKSLDRDDVENVYARLGGGTLR